MIGYRGALRYIARARPVRARARGDPPGLGRRPHEPPRDAAVRAHRRASSRAAARIVAESGLLDRAGLRALGDGRGAVGALQPRALRRRSASPGISIGSNDLTQLLLGADRDSELLAESSTSATPPSPRTCRQLIPRARGARPADLDLRPGARRCTPSTPSCSSAPGSTRSRSTSTSSTATRRLIAAAEQRLLLDAARSTMEVAS